MQYENSTITTTDPEPASQDLKSADSGVRCYSRFSVAQRYLHGFLAVTFLGLAMTGLPLRFSSAPWATAMAHAVGGFGTILFFHLFSAVIMTVAFLIHV